MECSECTRLKRLLSEAIADREKSFAAAGDALLPVNTADTADLGNRLHLAHSEQAVHELRATLVKHEAAHKANDPA
jgi:hypothetical protein